MSHQPLPDDLRALLVMLDDVDGDVRALTDGLTETGGAWRASATSWSVAECLDHLATANRVYLAAMTPAAMAARAAGRARRGPATPGVIGRWFVRSMEPPVTTPMKGRAPGAIRPRTAPPLASARSDFAASQEAVRAFIREQADLDLAGVRFVNPFVAGVRFSLATGLHVVAAHERRHVWQAWRVRRAGATALAA